MMKTRYYSVDIAKFFFSLMIATFHLWSFYEVPEYGGFIAVEFFFIVSGFFLTKRHEELSGEITPAEFTWTRVKKYYPHYLFSFIMMYLASNLFVHGSDFKGLIKSFFEHLPEVFMLHGTILSDEATSTYNGLTWYISSLLLVGYVLWALLNRNKKSVFQAAPIVSFWIYAYMSYTLGTTNNWRSHVFGILNYSILRGAAGMSLGVVVYRLKEHVTNITGGGTSLPWGIFADARVLCQLCLVWPGKLYICRLFWDLFDADDGRRRSAFL